MVEGRWRPHPHFGAWFASGKGIGDGMWGMGYGAKKGKERLWNNEKGKRKENRKAEKTVHEKICNLTNRPRPDETPAYIFKISHTTFLTNPVGYSKQIIL